MGIIKHQSHLGLNGPNNPLNGQLKLGSAEHLWDRFYHHDYAARLSKVHAPCSVCWNKVKADF